MFPVFFFADTVKTTDRQTSMATSIISASLCGNRDVVHGRLQYHRRRRFLQVHQLGEDYRILAESGEDDGNHGCEEDVEQQRG